MNGVSVIIPCLNEEKYIASCLESIIDNGFDTNQLEILLVDGGSSDQTIQIVSSIQSKYSFVKIIENKKKKTPFALNIGIQQASYNTIMIAGAHAYYPQNYISTLYTSLNNTDIDVIGGGIETITKSSTKKSQAISYVLSHRAGVGNSAFRVGAGNLIEVDTVPFGLYKKQVFEDAGLYNERLIRNHDMELSSRIKAKGYKIWLHPKLKVTYFARDTYSGLMKNNFGNGLWNLKTYFITRKLSSLSLRHYIPLLFILSILIPPLFIPVFGLKVAILSIISFVAYSSLILIIAIKAKKVSMFYLLVAFLSLHFSYGFGSLVGLFSILKLWR